MATGCRRTLTIKMNTTAASALTTRNRHSAALGLITVPPLH